MTDKRKTGVGAKVSFAAAPLVLVAALTAALWHHEGRIYTTYWDDLGKVWTVCAGVTGEGVIPGKTYTDDECTALEQRYLTKMLRHMGKCVQGEFTFPVIKAFGHFAYNIGTPAFCRSTAARMLNAGNVAGACKQIGRWTYVKGKDCRIRSNNCAGIVTRRHWEETTCESGL